MGFRTGRCYTLAWPEGDPLHGLEITVRARTFGAVRAVAGRVQSGELAGWELTDHELKEFVSGVVSWTLEDDDGAPLPPTVENLRQLELRDIETIIRTWSRRSTGEDPIPDPLDGPSTDGEPTVTTPSTLASLPTETLPASL